MPAFFTSRQNILSKAWSLLACARHAFFPVTALCGETGFGITGRTSAKSLLSVITSRSLTVLNAPSVFGR